MATELPSASALQDVVWTLNDADLTVFEDTVRRVRMTREWYKAVDRMNGVMDVDSDMNLDATGLKKIQNTPYKALKERVYADRRFEEKRGKTTKMTLQIDIDATPDTMTMEIVHATNKYYAEEEVEKMRIHLNHKHQNVCVLQYKAYLVSDERPKVAMEVETLVELFRKKHIQPTMFIQIVRVLPTITQNLSQKAQKTLKQVQIKIEKYTHHDGTADDTDDAEQTDESQSDREHDENDESGTENSEDREFIVEEEQDEEDEQLAQHILRQYLKHNGPRHNRSDVRRSGRIRRRASEHEQENIEHHSRRHRAKYSSDFESQNEAENEFSSSSSVDEQRLDDECELDKSATNDDKNTKRTHSNSFENDYHNENALPLPKKIRIHARRDNHIHFDRHSSSIEQNSSATMSVNVLPTEKASLQSFGTNHSPIDSINETDSSDDSDVKQTVAAFQEIGRELRANNIPSFPVSDTSVSQQANMKSITSSNDNKHDQIVEEHSKMKHRSRTRTEKKKRKKSKKQKKQCKSAESYVNQ